MKLIRQLAVALGVAVLCGSTMAGLEEGRRLFKAEEYKKSLDILSSEDAVEHLEAQLMIGRIYAIGKDGILQDFELAKNIWMKQLNRARKLADKGDASAEYYLGFMYETGGLSDRDLACSWYKKAAQNGHSEAQNSLSICYLYGLGMQKNMELGVEWARKSASQGNTDAYYTLGLAYEDGSGVPKDLSMALFWFEKAAIEGGGTTSNCDVGWMHLKGKGVKANPISASKWINKAAQKGSDACQFILGNMYELGEGVNQSAQTALYWYQKSAEQGNARAQYKLGKLHEEGLGISKDISQAVFWYDIAAKQGNSDALSALKRLKSVKFSASNQ